MKTTATLLAGLLAMSLLAMTPTASAHSCTSSDDNCNQPCDNTEEHSHNWRDSSGRYQSCNSTPNEPDPEELTVCDIYRLIYEIVDGRVVLKGFANTQANTDSDSKVNVLEFRQADCDPPAQFDTVTPAYSTGGIAALSW